MLGDASVLGLMQSAKQHCHCRRLCREQKSLSWEILSESTLCHWQTVPSGHTAEQERSLICLTPTVYAGAFACCIDDLFVNLLVTAIAADTVSLTQPIYCLWFHYMWSNIIGPELGQEHSMSC